MHKFNKIFFVSFFTFFFTVPNVFGLSCMPPPIESRYETVEYIFIAKVTGHGLTWQKGSMNVWTDIKMELKEVFKESGEIGKLPKKFDLSANTYWGNTFLVEKEFLVFANTLNGRLANDVCSGTKLVEQAQEEIDYLKSVKKNSSATEKFRIEEVITGDTLRLSNGEVVRLLGIDAPEIEDTKKARLDSERTGRSLEQTIQAGKDAAATVEHLVKGQEVHLEFDKKKRNDNNQLLAYVFQYGGRKDTHLMKKYAKGMHYMNLNDGSYMFLNATMVGLGFATPMTVLPNNQYSRLFNKLHQDAYENRRGFYRDVKNDLIPDGTYYEYYDDGSVRIEATYKDNRLLETKAYDEQGKAMMEKKYEYDEHGYLIQQ